MEVTPDSNDSNSGSPEKAPWKPWTNEEREAKLSELKKRVEQLTQLAEIQVKPSSDYEAWKQESQKKQLAEQIRSESVEVISKTPKAVVPLVENDEAYKKIIGQYNNDWKLISNNPDKAGEIMRIVKNSTAIEKAALNDSPNIIIPEGYKKRGQSTETIDVRMQTLMDKPKKETEEVPEGTFPEKGSLAETDAIIARFQTRNAERLQSSSLGNEIKVNTFTAEQQEAAKTEWLKNNKHNDGPLDIDLSLLEKDSVSPKNLDIDLTKLESDASKTVSSETLKQSSVEPRAVTPEKLQKIEAAYMTRAQESLKGVEQSVAVLEARKKGAMGRLLEKGLTGLQGGLEMFAKVSPKKKAAIGLMLAGASVATGGMTSILSKGLSTMSYASSHYNEKLQANEQAGIETNKKKLAVQSLARGLILAIATSELISMVTQNIDMKSVIDGAVEKASELKDGIKEMITNLTTSVEAVDVTSAIHDPTAINGLDLPPETLSAQDSLSPEESFVEPTSLAPLSEYTIKPGDNLTNIIKQQILPSIPGAENLTEFQKNNLIENYFKEAAKYRDVGLFDSVNQFANPNLIHPGDHLDLEMMRKGMTELKFPNLGGGSLLDHAKTFSGSVGTGSVGVTTSLQDLLEGSAPEDTKELIRQEIPQEPSQILDEDISGVKDSVLYDDSSDNPRIKGLGYRNNA